MMDYDAKSMKDDLDDTVGHDAISSVLQGRKSGMGHGMMQGKECKGELLLRPVVTSCKDG